MRPQRRHARAAADIDHFLLRRLEVKVAGRPDGADRIAGLEAEHVGRTDAGRTVLSRWRRGDADVEAQRGFGAGVAGH